jgi:polysaccharide biosynthesis protein PslG
VRPQARGDMWARSAIAVLVSAFVSLMAAPAARATHLTDPGSSPGPAVPWGFNEDWGWRDGVFSTGVASQGIEQGAAIMPDHLSANRFHVQWADVEEQQGVYDWGHTDGVYAAMQADAARPVLLLYNAPSWARDPAATCPSTNPCAYPPLPQYDPDWAQFVQAAVSRYPDVRAIEIWNEPNLGRFWAPSADPERYSALLGSAHDAVEAANPGAPVLSGGLVPTGTNETNVAAAAFLRDVYSSAGAEQFEGIGTHPYPHNAPFVDTMWRRLDALRTVRDEAGDAATPLWITEVGVSTDGASGVALEEQGLVLIQLYRSIEAHDVASFIIHRLYDIGTEGSYWNQTGVIYQDRVPKPAYCELGQAIGTPCSTARASVGPETRTLSLDAGKNKVKKGNHVPLSGRISATREPDVCAAYQAVELQRKKLGHTTFTTFQQILTDAQGSFSTKVKVKKTSEYQAQVAESSTCDDALSNTEKVKVKKRRS